MELFERCFGRNNNRYVIRTPTLCLLFPLYIDVMRVFRFSGAIWGFMTGLVTRFTDNVRVIEPIFIFIMAYLAYLNAEMLHLSGILS